jgi:uncharacterized membrane protein
MTKASPIQLALSNRQLDSIVSTTITGVLIVVPVYLAGLLVLNALKSMAGLVEPIVKLLPDWLPAQNLVSILVLLLVCFLVGVIDRTPVGHRTRARLEKTLFQRIPGYALLTSLTQRLAGETQENVWQPVLVDFDEALVPAFIIEELEDGRLTLFVPSAPTPLAGAIYVLDRARVHPIDVPFTQATKVISQWGFGSKELVAAMRPQLPAG